MSFRCFTVLQKTRWFSTRTQALPQTDPQPEGG
jgi:hypothetical protein